MSANGPTCPANPRHGRMYSVDRGGDYRFGFRCMHSDHGGNGRKFTQDEIDHYELKETDMAQIIDATARDIVDGKMDLDTAAGQVAKATKQSRANVLAALTKAVEATKDLDAQKAAEKAEAKERKMAKAKAEPKEKASRVKKEHIEPAEFAAVRDRLGLKNKEVAAALQAAGMGATLSRVTELTHSKGSSADLFAKFEAALVSWREANPAAAEEPAEAPAPEA